MAAAVTANSGGLDVAPAQSLSIQVVTGRSSTHLYDVSKDGQKFLVAVPTEQTVESPLTLVQNWTARLKK